MMRCVRMLLAVFCLSSLTAKAVEFQVITNVQNPAYADKISSSDLKDIYLGKMNVFNNGTKVQPARLSGSIDEAFIGSVFERSVSRYEEVLKKILFSGKAIPPKNFSNEEQLVEYIKGNAGGIGVISKKDVAGVKYLSIQD